MYNLLGDPLLRWRRPIELDVFAPTEIIVGDPLAVEIRSEISGNCLLELLSAGDLSSEPIAKESTKINSGRSQFTISVTPGTPGAYTLRAFVAGREASAVGSTPIQIRRDAPRLSKAAKGISTVQ